jgi:hypothetical protein
MPSEELGALDGFESGSTNLGQGPQLLKDVAVGMGGNCGDGCSYDRSKMSGIFYPRRGLSDG